MKDEFIWGVGTTNKAKVECLRFTAEKCFPSHRHVVTAVAVESSVNAQPMSAVETRAGAFHRATSALQLVPGAHYGVGLEGGVEQIGEEWFECGWMCVVHKASGIVGWGSSARFQMSPKIMHKLTTEKKELATIMDELSGLTDVRSNLGAMGILTNGHLGRAEAYSHGLIFALAPFLSDRAQYWE